MGRLCFITTRRRRDLAEETSQTSRRTLKKGSRRRGPANLEDQKRPRRPAEGPSKRAAEEEVLQISKTRRDLADHQKDPQKGQPKKRSCKSRRPEETSQTRKRPLKKSSRKRGPAAVFWQTTNETSNENTKGGISRRFSRQSPPG